METFFKYFVLFSVGGLSYMLIETLYSGSTHWTMGILGGICFIFIGLINTFFDLPLYKQMLMGAVIVTALEFITGVILNLGFSLAIWNYSNHFLNISGQVCLLYSFYWFLLCLPAIYLDDFIRHQFFGEPKKHYRLF